jgi:hypothetical protein
MKKRIYHDIAVIGGGLAGIMAALSSSLNNKDVCIIEGNERIGKKILITGDGKCNLTNRVMRDENFHSSNKGFFKSVLKQFSNKDTIKFFDKLGLITTILDDGRVYPISFQASSVLDILRFALDENHISIITNFRVSDIKKIKNVFEIMDSLGNIVESKKVILACGGKAAPFTGSDGSGYDLAINLGHKIINPMPSLVQLKLNFQGLRGLAGVRFEGDAEIYVDGYSEGKAHGEILFTNYGVSGPAILKLSRIASIELQRKRRVSVKINLLPKFNSVQIKEILKKYIDQYFNRSIWNILIGLINKKVIPILLKDAGLENIHKSAGKMTHSDLCSIVQHLTEWQFEISGTLSFKDAQVTAGGVDTRDVDPSTLESRIVKRLYFAGEILDVDGDSGGYNLQWAMSSGWVAGKSAGKK